MCVLLFDCTGFVCVMCSEQAVLLFTAMPVPLGIGRRKALLRLVIRVMEKTLEDIERDAWGFVWRIQRYIYPSAPSLLFFSLTPILLHYLDSPSTSCLTNESWADTVEVGFLCAPSHDAIRTPTLTTQSMHRLWDLTAQQMITALFGSIPYSAVDTTEERKITLRQSPTHGWGERLELSIKNWDWDTFLASRVKASYTDVFYHFKCKAIAVVKLHQKYFSGQEDLRRWCSHRAD